MKSGAIAASFAGSSGGNSTTRITVPLSGGFSPSGLVTVSAVKEKPGGSESVIHRFAAGLPDPSRLESQAAVEQHDSLVILIDPGDDAPYLCCAARRASEHNHEKGPEQSANHVFLQPFCFTCDLIREA